MAEAKNLNRMGISFAHYFKDDPLITQKLDKRFKTEHEITGVSTIPLRQMQTIFSELKIKFTTAAFWLTKIHLGRGEKVNRTLLDSLDLRLDSYFYLYEFNDAIGQAIVYDAYKKSSDSPVIGSKVASWTAKDGINWTDVYVWKRTENLNGVHFRVTTGKVSTNRL